jgi:hypothetical protein
MVLVNYPLSWQWRPESPPLLLDWYREYARRHYELVGVVDLIDLERVVMHWDEAARDYEIESENHLLVMRRRYR